MTVEHLEPYRPPLSLTKCSRCAGLALPDSMLRCNRRHSCLWVPHLLLNEGGLSHARDLGLCGRVQILSDSGHLLT